eukprot:8128373-Lingulodinium_polyedra.AAC.1
MASTLMRESSLAPRRLRQCVWNIAFCSRSTWAYLRKSVRSPSRVPKATRSTSNANRASLG